MNDLESLVRETLTDERRRVDTPLHTTQWVRSEVSRQRRRTAVVAGALTTTLVAAGALIAVPLLNDNSANYVAGPPDAASGLLPWKPVGTLADDSDAAASAVTAWEDATEDEPAGDVHVIAAQQWRDTQVVVLQARIDSGAATTALLTRSEDGPGDWALLDTATVPASEEVEALQLPGNIVGGTPPRRLGPGDPPSLILGPQWRTSSLRAASLSLGWQLVPAGAGFGETPAWEPLDHPRGNGWWAPLMSESGVQLAPTTVVLDHERRGYAEVAPVLDVGSAGSLTALTAGEISLRLLPREGASPGAVDQVEAVAELLDISGPIEATVLSQGSGSVSVGKSDPAPTESMFAQLVTPGARPLLVAYATTDGEITCFSHRTIPEGDVLTMPFVGLACPAPVGGGERKGVEGFEFWSSSFTTRYQPKNPLLTYRVTLVRSNGESTARSLEGGGGWYLTEDQAAPVERFIFRATDTETGTTLEPWVWPGSELPR
jgi:hypothetical protein